jgi:hypothetical protein
LGSLGSTNALFTISVESREGVDDLVKTRICCGRDSSPQQSRGSWLHVRLEFLRSRRANATKAPPFWWRFLLGRSD